MFKLNKIPRKQTLVYLAIAVLFIWAFTCMNNKPKNRVNGMSMYKRRPSRYAPGAPAASVQEPMEPVMEQTAGVIGMDVDSIDSMYAPAEVSTSNGDLQTSCAAANGVGLASSLLPREAASSDNFGEFAPDQILKDQSFLQPRDQVGMPETLGGALRNANQQIRAEPPNPKKPYVWQNSTIAPDAMQRPLV
tara:strand:- start:70 stop:642 length:573 start_codon:yes stop_codon:yes gene_type:complete